MKAAIYLVLALAYFYLAIRHNDQSKRLVRMGFPASAMARRHIVLLLTVAAFVFGFDAVQAARADNVSPADTVAEIPGVAKFTDQRGDCPRLWRVAIAPNGEHGCWTIGERTRAVMIRWPSGVVVRYSETQFNIYAR